MKKTLLILIAALLATPAIYGQQTSTTRFMQVTTIESVVGGGVGRSKMIITKSDSTQETKDLNNMFSFTGINFSNIMQNEGTILQTLQSYTAHGWKLVATIPLTLSPGSKGEGIFMTRYLFSKDN